MNDYMGMFTIKKSHFLQKTAIHLKYSRDKFSALTKESQENISVLTHGDCILAMSLKIRDEFEITQKICL